MDIDLMREFVVFSRYLNFSKVAGQLNLAQPTLSSHVASMEKELGFYVPLIGIEDLIRPSFVFLRDNDNPALDLFAEFITSL